MNAFCLQNGPGSFQFMRNSQRGVSQVEVHMKAALTTHPDKDSDMHLEGRIGEQVMKGMIRGRQRASN